LLPPSQAILVGEDAEQYHLLLNEITHSVEPADIIEQFWVRDITGLLWVTLRLRRLKGNLLHVAMRDGLQRVLSPMVEGSVDALVRQWYEGNHKAQEDIDEILEKAGLSFDSVMAEALSSRLDPIDRIDRMITSAETRRHAVLREISRHRDALAARLALVSDTIVEADFAKVDSSDDQTLTDGGERA
jgi:hypothetical protein